MAYERRKNFKRILTILKLKWRIFYMRYVKIIVLAIMEVIAELYLRRDKK
jgi:hypothetical protein